MLQRVRRRAIDLATKTQIRHITGPVYNRMVAAEIRLVRRRDGPKPLAPVEDVTALIKTFERPLICRRLLDSIRRLYPTLPIVVVDDSRHPGDWPGTHAVVLPYDVGLSAGRNEGLKHVETELFILLDDDFVFYRETDLSRAVAFMRAHPDVDLYGGQVLDLPFFERGVSSDNRDCFGGPPRTVDGFPVYDRIACFFIGRTRTVAALGFDPRLKLCEHTEFFWRARGKLVTVFDESFRILHGKTPFDAEYMKKRGDVARYLLLLRDLMKG